MIIWVCDQTSWVSSNLMIMWPAWWQYWALQDHEASNINCQPRLCWTPDFSQVLPAQERRIIQGCSCAATAWVVTLDIQQYNTDYSRNQVGDWPGIILSLAVAVNFSKESSHLLLLTGKFPGKYAAQFCFTPLAWSFSRRGRSQRSQRCDRDSQGQQGQIWTRQRYR